MTQRAIGILQVCETAGGGIATYLNELVPFLQARKSELQVALVLPSDHGEMPDVDLSSAIFFSRTSRLKGLFRFPFAVLKALAQYRPDVVHAHSTFAGIVVRILAPFFGAKVIYCPHGWAMDRDQSEIAKRTEALLEMMLSHVTDRVIAISDYEREVGEKNGIPAKKLQLVYNGLRVKQTSVEPANWSDPRLRVLFVGRLDRQKGVDILLTACRKLSSQVSVRIIGASVVGEVFAPEYKPCNVEMLGWMSQNAVQSQIASCDVVVIPSRWEGFGLVAAEAMRQAKAVIASDVGGLPELVLHGKTGYLFPKNDAHALASYLGSVNRAELERLGRSGRQRFLQRFTTERMVEEILAVYQAVTGKQIETHNHDLVRS